MKEHNKWKWNIFMFYGKKIMWWCYNKRDSSIEKTDERSAPPSPTPSAILFSKTIFYLYTKPCHTLLMHSNLFTEYSTRNLEEQGPVIIIIRTVILFILSFSAFFHPNRQKNTENDKTLPYKWSGIHAFSQLLKIIFFLIK